MDDGFRRGCLVRVLADINGTAILGKFLVRRVIMYFGDISMYHTGRANARHTSRSQTDTFHATAESYFTDSLTNKQLIRLI